MASPVRQYDPPQRRPATRSRALPTIPAPVAVGVLCLILLGLVDALIRHETKLTGDEPYYERMATHPGGPHNFPYAYRVAVPWLVHVLPFSHATSFTALALICSAAAAGALYALLMEFDIEPWLAVGLCVGFALSPALVVVLPRHGRSVDPASILVLMLGCLFIVRRQQVALALTMLIGVSVRESTLFLIPLAYAVWAERLIDPRALRDTALAAVMPVAAYAVLRSSVQAVGRQYEPGYSGPFLDARFDLIGQALSGHSWAVELRRLAYTYGPLWLVAPFALRDLRFARRGLVLVALCVGSMTFAYDWGRIIFLAAPVFYVASAHVLRGRRRLAVATVVALLAVDIGYGVYLQVYGVQHGLNTSVSRGIPVY
jgi:hypothetical protein